MRGWAAASAPFPGDLAPARVVGATRGLCSALSASGLERLGLSGGMLDQVASDPAASPWVGDWVLLRRWCDGRATLEHVLPRRSGVDVCEVGTVSPRPAPVANVDVVAAVAGLDHDVPTAALCRQRAVVRDAGAASVVVLSKADLAPDGEAVARRVRLALPGVEVVVCSSADGRGVDRLWRLAHRRTVVLHGPTGAGISALVRRLAGADVLEVPFGTAGRDGPPASHGCALVVLPGGGCLVGAHAG